MHICSCSIWLCEQEIKVIEILQVKGLIAGEGIGD